MLNCLKVGDLVTVRLDETGWSRFLLPGIIVSKFTGNYENKNRQMYEVLARGETVCVTDTDLGPIDMFIDENCLRDRRNNV